MNFSPPPANEDKRFEALRSYQILDIQKEKDFPYLFKNRTHTILFNYQRSILEISVLRENGFQRLLENHSNKL